MKIMNNKLHGFTLVELLVVITIIGILIALLLPAVQAAREAARRLQCSNNLRQVGLAMAEYESRHGCLPPGALNTGFPTRYPRTSWMVHLLPGMELQNIYDLFDFDLPAGPGDAVWTASGNLPAVGMATPTLLCPSDGLGGLVHHHSAGIGDFARGNYAGFFGNVDYGSAEPPVAPPHRPAAFAINIVVRVADIRDGTSNTMACGEVLTGLGTDDDYRGVHWYDLVACSQIFTQFPPNTPNPDIVHPMWCSANQNQPSLNLPCVGGASDERTDTAASRSRHPGGVHVSFCDGSVHFANDNIGLSVWQALGSIAGTNEPVVSLD